MPTGRRDCGVETGTPSARRATLLFRGEVRGFQVWPVVCTLSNASTFSKLKKVFFYLITYEFFDLKCPENMLNYYH